MKRIFLVLLAVGITSSLSAQREPGKRDAGTDVVYLIDGSIFRGEIVFYDVDKELQLKLSDVVTITIESAKIEKIIQEKTKGKYKEERELSFRKFYNTTSFYPLGGYFEGDLQVGLGIQSTFGYQWKHWLAAGVGVAYDNYYLDDRIAIVPVFAEFKGQVNRNRIAPAFSLQAGYGWANDDPDRGIEKAEGGAMMQGTFGLVAHNRGSNNAWTFDMGYRFQQLKYRRTFDWTRDFEDYQIFYKRLVFRFGYTF